MDDEKSKALTYKVPSCRSCEKITIEILVDNSKRNGAVVPASQGTNGGDGFSFEGEHEEYQYLNLVRHIITKGMKRIDRTGIETYGAFGTQMRFSLKNNVFPLLTTRRVFWRGVIEEMLWLVKGSTNAKDLSSRNVKIWDVNSSREYLDGMGFNDREEGDLGPIYGFQWRHFGAEYRGMRANYTGEGIDQLSQVIETIKKYPNDRRIILCSWNPVDISQMALPPCHCLMQFFVHDNELSSLLYQRSADMGLGVPFNIASYALLTIMIAHVTGLKPCEFIHTIGDSHVFQNHVMALKEQIQRVPKPFPTLHIRRNITNIEDFIYSDFDLCNYHPHSRISSDLSVV